MKDTETERNRDKYRARQRQRTRQRPIGESETHRGTELDKHMHRTRMIEIDRRFRGRTEGASQMDRRSGNGKERVLRE